MSLNEAKGNMYGFVTHTWNTVKGKCPHGCSYCYMKRWGEQKPIRFDKRELKTDLGSGNFIFIGSSCDMFAEGMPSEWIVETLEKANQYKNNYLVQSKTPERFLQFHTMLPPESFTLCTTIETNFVYSEIMGYTPAPEIRADTISKLTEHKHMITVEPIMEFDVKALSHLILSAWPDQVNIGADSGNNGLPEPSGKKIRQLIEVLSRHTKVFQKPNLARLLKA
ncbi:hypothetical protein AGMMS50268_03820 [Spirochaetia bacterium]|nr:hypothetical protein AGMMS50268_03820 [Spirochaetia bacterium]